jgi:hypothetical protein
MLYSCTHVGGCSLAIACVGMHTICVILAMMAWATGWACCFFHGRGLLVGLGCPLIMICDYMGKGGSLACAHGSVSVTRGHSCHSKSALPIEVNRVLCIKRLSSECMVAGGPAGVCKAAELSTNPECCAQG